VSLAELEGKTCACGQRATAVLRTVTPLGGGALRTETAYYCWRHDPHGACRQRQAWLADVLADPWKQQGMLEEIEMARRRQGRGGG
jgi:hypothetical protein